MICDEGPNECELAMACSCYCYLSVHDKLESSFALAVPSWHNTNEPISKQ